MEQGQVYYKVTNTSAIPCSKTWNKALLEEEDIDRYEKFKETDDYIGRSEEDKATRKKLAEAIKVRQFYETMGKDVQMRIYDRRAMGKSTVSEPRYEWKFVIGPSMEAFKALSISEARRICERYEIEHTLNDTVPMLAQKMRRKFGENIRILSARQWLESGLKQLERKEIKMKLRPGELEARVTNSGFLVADEMAEIEVKEYYKKEADKQEKENKKLKELDKKK